jgi:hypothetical protein
METFGFSQSHRRKVASMRFSPIVLPLFKILGCDSGTQLAKPPASVEQIRSLALKILTEKDPRQE